MKALSLLEINQPPVLVDIDRPTKGPDDVKIQISHAALNRRDVWITKGHYPHIKTPAILGSDGVGRLLEATSRCAKNSRVVICPSLNWGDREDTQSDAYEILGMPRQGTLAEEIAVPTYSVYPAPEHLTDAEAAALPLAGLTAWRALCTRGEVKSGSRVLITGVGGGVSSIAVQFAIAAGAEVTVTSSSDEKLIQAREWGCSSGLNYRKDTYQERLKTEFKNAFDLIVDGAGGAGVGLLLNTLAPAGRFVFYGGTAGKWPSISPQRLFFKQVSLLASTMGSPQDFEAMLNFVTEHRIVPAVDRVFSLEEGAKAFDHLEASQQTGKVIIKIG
ncbi:MAG: quinone oxidoreductase family protein [Bradymonadia bacterium]